MSAAPPPGSGTTTVAALSSATASTPSAGSTSTVVPVGLCPTPPPASSAAAAAPSAAAAAPLPPYPGRRTDMLQTSPVEPLPGKSPEWMAAWNLAGNDIQRLHTDPLSVWAFDAAKANHTQIQQRLTQFAAGPVGASVKNLDLRTFIGNPAGLHTQLLANGFRHQRVPLAAGVSASAGGALLYRTRNGGTTSDPADPNIVPHDIYTHDDGGIVRVKPEGDPGSEVRKQPHAVKAVLFTPHQNNLVTDEAFKVTNSGQAVPSMPSPAAGMRKTRPCDCGATHTPPQTSAPHGNQLSQGQTKGGYLMRVLVDGHTDI